ncbi:hypothetical protein K505DRAFT_377133 [Melanomma pulvis-pyrius CBS 109.77]|uniref:Uncharacterized protein n=1 Tax=Melanomma pulvis-pyrius CBS 109.77 TaxID=1314802 RepID=A0A6A6X3R5_9PLEO|nr:hypothetical protein K505DRAFT_377133 [Melanomma pulvis-pyrius CBS 109.77]
MSRLRQCILFCALLSLSVAQDPEFRFARDCFMAVPGAVIPSQEPAFVQRLKSGFGLIADSCDKPAVFNKNGEPDGILFTHQFEGMTFDVLKSTPDAKDLSKSLCQAAFDRIVDLCFDTTSAQGGRAIAVDNGLEFRMYDSQHQPLEIQAPDIGPGQPGTVPSIPEPPPKNVSLSFAMDCGADQYPSASIIAEYTSQERSSVNTTISDYCDSTEGKVQIGENNIFLRWYSGIGWVYQLRLLNGAAPPGKSNCVAAFNKILTQCMGGDQRAQGLALEVQGRYEFKVYRSELVGSEEPFSTPNRRRVRRGAARRRASRFT